MHYKMYTPFWTSLTRGTNSLRKAKRAASLKSVKN